MTIPCQYPYNSTWKTILLCGGMFGFAASFFVEKAVNNDRGLIINGLIELDQNGGTMFFWALAFCSILFVAAAVALAFRKVVSPRTLVFDADAVIIPHGILQKKTSRVEYSEITGLSEQLVSRQKFLKVHTLQREYSITASLLPDKKSYEEVKDILSKQVQLNH